MTRTVIKTVWCLAGAIVVLAGVLRSATASDESLKLVRQGAAALERQDADAALRLFERAEAADPKDAQAVFLHGVAWNRLMQFKEANEKLLRSEEMGAKNPALDLEVGWSLVGLEDYDKAILRLTRYERAHPGSATTSFLLGRAFVGTGEWDKATARLNEAIQRDARIESAAKVYLSVAASERGDDVGAENHIADLLDSSAIRCNALCRVFPATSTSLESGCSSSGSRRLRFGSRWVLRSIRIRRRSRRPCR